GTCCISDFKGAGRIYLGSLTEDGKNVYNSKLFLAARTLLARPEEYAADVGGLSASERPFCDGCTNRPRPQVGLDATHYYLQRSHSLAGAPSPVLEALGGWSEHDSGCAPSPPPSDQTASAISAMPGVPAISFGGEADESLSLLAPDFAEASVDGETFHARYITGGRVAGSYPNFHHRQRDPTAFLSRHQKRDPRGGARVGGAFVRHDRRDATHFLAL